MGDRFVLVRVDSTKGWQAAGRKAIGNTGEEIQMRQELADAVAGVLAGMDATGVTVTDEETDLLLAAADLVTRARTAVERDYQGNVTDAHAPEMPTRFAKELTQIIRGAVAIGMDRHDALKLAIRCARDSMPPLRLAIIDDLAANPDSTLAEVRKRLNEPRATVDRELQALHMLGVLDCDERDEVTRRTGNEVTRWHYSLTDGIESTAINPAKLPIKSVPTPRPQEERDLGDDASRLVSDKAGNFAPSGDDPPAAPSASQESATSATSATGPPYYTCLTEGCTTGLYADDSQQLG